MELFIGNNLLVRKIKELLLNNFVLNAKESTTLSMNKGQISEAHVRFDTRSTAQC